MLEWLTKWSDVVNAVINLGMLIVWITYLQVFWRNYRRQTRPQIIITRAVGSNLNAACFIGNMSAQSIYVESVIAYVRSAGEEEAAAITDIIFKDGSTEVTDQRHKTHQGPLLSGQYMSIGTFQDMMEQAARSYKEREDTGSEAELEIELLVIADYASDPLFIAARRTFSVVRSSSSSEVTPKDVRTIQVTDRRSRRQLPRVLAEFNG